MQDCHLRTVTHWRCVHNSAFLAAPPSELTEYERKRVFFIAPSVGSFSSPGKSFCILKYLASLGFANPLSINWRHFLISHFLNIYSHNLFASQYSQKALSLFRPYTILENKRMSKAVLMIQSCTWFADVNECITGENNCDANGPNAIKKLKKKLDKLAQNLGEKLEKKKKLALRACWPKIFQD